MFKEKRYNEVLGILIILISIILLLSLVNFNIQDRNNLARSIPVDNLIGPAGVYISHALRYVFGFSSFFFVVLLAAAGLEIIKNRKKNEILEHSLSILFFMICSTAFMTLLSSKPLFQTGGILGHAIYTFLSTHLGDIGSFLVILIFNFIGLVLMGLISISELVNDPKSVKEQLQKYIERMKSLVKKKERAPLNFIEEKLYPGKKRIPWITKKTIILKYSEESESIRQSLKYLEMSLPSITGTEDEGEDSHSDDHLYEGVFSDSECESLNTDIDDQETLHYEAVIDDYKIELDDEKDAVERRYLEKMEDDIQEIYRSEIIDTKVTEDKTSPEIQETESEELFKEKKSLKKTEDTIVISDLTDEITINEDYIIPTKFLHTSKDESPEDWKSEISKNSELLVNALADFSIESKVINVNRGPVITLYELQIAPGIKVNRIVGLADDIAMALAALRVRIVAPIPGKSAIGVEIPNRKREIVTLGDVLKSDVFHSQTGYLNVALGKDILGHPVTLDLKTLPHLLIAGATGSGKSVCVNSIITSLIYNYDPEYLKFILVDPKMVELQVYNGLPHLLTPVITESKMAQVALKWTIYEMERRYRILSEYNCRNIERYNSQSDTLFEVEKLPYIVTIIDELADLIMVATKEVEGYITRIAQKARAVGIHLVLATQRPSVDVITGIIKANFPARIAFQVAQKTDSRTILDQNGAEKLLGQGDLLYQSPISSFPIRIQGTYISEDEILSIVNHLGKLYRPQYIDISESVEETEEKIEENSSDDELFVEALKIVEETRKASASYLQRRLSIGYNRAARIVELMEERGYVGPQQGSKPREVFI